MGFLNGLHMVMHAHNTFQKSRSIDLDPDILALDAYALSCHETEKSVSHNDVHETFFTLDLIGFSISFIALSVVGLVILCDKRLRTHPNEIIAFICLSDAYNYW